MREKRYIGLLWTVLAGVAALSCTKVQRAEYEREIRYEVVGTKAAEAYPETGEFLSWAWYLPEGSAWSTDRASSQLYINAAHISFSGGSWHDVSTSYWWPKTGSLTFFALSPSSIGSYASCTNTGGIRLTDYDVDANPTEDVMTADLAADKTANEGPSIGTWAPGVPTVFRHKLSKVEGFVFDTFKDYANGHDGSSEHPYQNNDYTFHIKEISINNYIQTGTFDSGLTPDSAHIGSWTISSTAAAKSYTWYKNDVGVQAGYGTPTTVPPALPDGRDYLYLLPQAFSKPADIDNAPNIKIVYEKRTYSDGGGYSSETITATASLYDVFSGTANRLVLNRRITFRITINMDSNLIYWAPNQEEWASGGDGYHISI